MRDSLREFGGYEIHTEGDSFQMAFGTVASAVRFCISVQHKFLEERWSPDILKLPYCHTARDKLGRVIFRGPRVRMGIHWAQSHLIQRRVHPMTQHTVFEGPAFDTTKEVSDAANGGQILMTHEAWLHFMNEFPHAQFPTIEQLGFYMLTNVPEPILLYEVSQYVGKRLVRPFGPLRKVRYVWITCLRKGMMACFRFQEGLAY